MGRQTQDVSIYDEENDISAKITSDGRLKVDAQVSETEVNGLKSLDILVDGLVQLPDNPCKWVIIQPEDILFNNNPVYVGGSDLDSGNGFRVFGGENLELDVSNSNQIFLYTYNNSRHVRVLIGLK